MHSILFVCTGNQFRSPVAAEAFRQQLNQDGKSSEWIVNSAGTWADNGRAIMRESQVLAASCGMDLSAHLTRGLDKTLLENSELVLVMESGHKESIHVEFPFARNKVFLISEFLEGTAYDIPDPISVPGEGRQILLELIATIKNGAGRIYQFVDDKN